MDNNMKNDMETGGYRVGLGVGWTYFWLAMKEGVDPYSSHHITSSDLHNA